MKNKVFIIAEAGSNWKAGSPAQDLKRAYELIAVAAEAGADAVKFQTYRAESVYVPNAGTSDYLSKHGIRESITTIFKRLAMPYTMIPKLAQDARRKKIEFMSSPFSTEDFKAVDPYVKRHKIASYEITHIRLLELAARSGKPLILSTGASDYSDIDWAVCYFKKYGGRSITLMQCTAKYPAPFEALNLKVIPALAKKYRVSVGFSDHSSEPVIAPVAAVALGASVVEKHYTLSRKLQGPDHAFAIEPSELAAMVRAVRACEDSLGTADKKVSSDEQELRAYAQRAVQAIKDIKRGERFVEGVNIAILRPGKQKKGVHPRFIEKISGKKELNSIGLGKGIMENDYE